MHEEEHVKRWSICCWSADAHMLSRCCSAATQLCLVDKQPISAVPWLFFSSYPAVAVAQQLPSCCLVASQLFRS
jgi:hypothetical protein